MRTNVYIDGFNLYYGALRHTPYRWLDLGKLCKFLLPGYTVNNIRYFTALFRPFGNDWSKRARQRTYIRAIRTLPNVSVMYGHFLKQTVWARLASPPPTGSKNVEVVKIEEKGSDVNLATYLLWDAFRNEYDAAAIISNDSDLYEPIRLVKEELGKRVIVINPHSQRPSVELREIADEFKTIREGVLRACQFPNQMNDSRGAFEKPETW